jgi:GAF domain-containing protein
LRAILLRIAELDVRRPQDFGVQYIASLARELNTDRLTHCIVSAEGEMLHISQLGLRVEEEVTTAGKLILQAMESGQPLVIPNIREKPDLTALWADDYRTNSCAVLPMVYRHHPLGALCLSNLTEKQVLGMQMQRNEVMQFMALSGFITALAVQSMAAGERADAAKFAKLLA